LRAAVKALQSPWRDARIWHDDGSFRSLLIWLDELVVFQTTT
jgi:hypothetical protein